MTERWHRCFGWKVSDVELKGDDVHKEEPAGAFKVSGCESKDVQEYIRKRVRVADPVALVLIGTPGPDDELAFYAVQHLSQIVAVTSEYFGKTLFRILKRSPRWQVKWPSAIESLRVEVVDSVAGTEAASMRAGLGCSGIWLRVRVSGLGFLKI
jgi:hypothetical protein